jgi:hypothetical protein
MENEVHDGYKLSKLHTDSECHLRKTTIVIRVCSAHQWILESGHMLLVCVQLAGGVSVDARRIQYAVVFPSMSIIFLTRIEPNTALLSCKLRNVRSTQLHKCDKCRCRAGVCLKRIGTACAGGDYHEGSEQLKSGIDGQIKIEVAKINDYWGR